MLPLRSSIAPRRPGTVIVSLCCASASEASWDPCTPCNQKARPTKYQSPRDYVAANYASRTMRYSGVIVLKSPYVAVFLIGVASESGTILSKAAVSKLKDEKFTTELPVHCGPYVMAEWTPKQKVVMKADPKWTGTKPAFSEVHIVDVEDNKAAELAAAGSFSIAARRTFPTVSKNKVEQRT